MTRLLSSFAASAARKAANDNFISSRGALQRPQHALFGVSRRNRKVARPQALRIAIRLLLLASFWAVVLVAVSGAFLIGLAFVGLFAAAVAGFELIRRRLPRPAVLWPHDRRVIG
jgi:hypothetical protein